jgi:glycosyltransferase involved in cell wall biosynthesis
MSKKPRIAIAVSHPIQHFCPQYASYARYEDWELKVFFASALGYKEYEDKDFGKKIAWSNLRLEEFNHVFLNESKVVPVNKNLDAPTLYQELEKFDPDAIITYGYFQKFQRNVVKWGKKHNKRLFYIADSEFAHPEPLWKKVLKKIIFSPYFKKIDRFLTVGNFNEHYYSWFDIPLSKMIRTGFPIDIDRYNRTFDQKEELRKQVREKYDVQEDEIVLSVVGKLVPGKRHMDLLKALKALKKEHTTKIKALIIGSGPEMSNLKNYAEEQKVPEAIFCGFIHPEELPSYYAATDIYVHLSEREAHSLAVTEAIYIGCPVVISDRCGSYGPTDDVQPGKNGYVYPCGDIARLKNAIRDLASNPELLNRFGQNSRQIGLNAQKLAHGEGLKAAMTSLNLLNT